MASRKVNLTNTGEFQNAAFGQNGFRVINSGTVQPADEQYICIYCTGVTTTTPQGDALGGVDLQAGMVLYGDFTTITVATGNVIAYIR